MQRIKNILEQQNKFTKLARDYTANRDYAMAKYYYDRLEYVEKELETEKIQRVKERKQARKLKEKNHETTM